MAAIRSPSLQSFITAAEEEDRSHPTHLKASTPLAAVAAGAVELLASEVTVLNTVSKPLPFPVSAAEEKEAAREEVRLRHRVLDLR